MSVGDLIGVGAVGVRAPAATRTANAFARSGLLAAGAPGLSSARLRRRDGAVLPLAAQRWHDPVAEEEVSVLCTVAGPVLDLACGPGRLVRHLADVGVDALGVDSAADAVAAARRRGVAAVEADLWAPLPGEGTYATALLFDGNIGIGGAPTELLRRCAELLAPDGVLLAEVEPQGVVGEVTEARIEWAGRCSPWFPWATVGADQVPDLAAAAGMDLEVVEDHGGRCFARLRSLDA